MLTQHAWINKVFFASSKYIIQNIQFKDETVQISAEITLVVDIFFDLILRSFQG